MSPPLCTPCNTIADHFWTGEHGVGIGKRMYLRSELGDGTLGVMKAIKRTIDPYGIMNPGKVRLGCRGAR